MASLKFESVAGTTTAALDQVKIITLEDGTGNKYTLDTTTDNLKVAYTPNGGQAKEYTVDGLAAALGKLLTIGGTAGKSVLAEEVAKKPVVDALIPELAKDDGTTGIYTKKGVDDELAKKADTSALDNKANTVDVYTKTDTDTAFAKVDGANLDDAKVTAILEKLTDKVVKTTELPAKAAAKPVVDALIPELAKDDGTTGIYTKKGVDDELAKKANISVIPAAPDLSNYLEISKLAEEVAKKPVVEAIFDAQDGKKSILVNKLGEALDRVRDNADDKVYGAAGQEKIAKDFLGEKGLKPVPSEVASELIAKNKQDLADEVANNPDLQEAVAKNADLQEAVAAIPALQTAVAENVDLQEAVAENVDLQEAVAENVGLQEAVAENVDLQEAVAMNADLRTAVAADAGLRTAVAADAGLRTAVADDAGLQAVLANPNSIAAIPALQTAVAADAGLRTAVANNTDLQTAVAQNEDLQTAVMSQPSFEIPIDPSAPLSWDW
ncbi:hypothetical protein [Wolbachia endosymbiont of Cylisticus convexus]|uniref:hypothetical protein n=1 Tax=Wolbachia endosymbiont of Cylisticus convexus TaxID=118728 RepID=UPI0011C037FF|nr:hypothetical protein [Wolbachia endosymbiont of Cylisticus convexus]